MSDEIGKIIPTDLPAGDQQMMQSDLERAADAEKQETAEFVLTPEIEAMIMEKVQDIDNKGIAYSRVSNNESDLESVFRVGILGNSVHDPEGSVNPKKWAKITRKDHNAVVHFNIVGKSRIEPGFNSSKREIPQSRYVKANQDAIIIMFDLKRYHETSPVGPDEELDQKHRAYSADWREEIPIDGQYPTDEYGYRLSFRVAPSEIMGVIFKLTREMTDREVSDAILTNRISPDVTPEILKNIRAQDYNEERLDKKSYEIAQAMMAASKNRPEYLVPIYSVDGDVLWPRFMEHREIRAFVAERDAKKVEESRIGSETSSEEVSDQTAKVDEVN